MPLNQPTRIRCISSVVILLKKSFKKIKDFTDQYPQGCIVAGHTDDTEMMMESVFAVVDMFFVVVRYIGRQAVSTGAHGICINPFCILLPWR